MKRNMQRVLCDASRQVDDGKLEIVESSRAGAGN